jgi:hypothetical protein
MLAVALSPSARSNLLQKPSNALRFPAVSVKVQFSRSPRESLEGRKRGAMFLILAVVLVLLWLGGLVMFKTAGLLIHLLLLFAVVSLVMHFLSGRRTA